MLINILPYGKTKCEKTDHYRNNTNSLQLLAALLLLHRAVFFKCPTMTFLLNRL